MEFTTIKNGVDNKLTIIRHNDSGFYNITKTAKLIFELMQEDNKCDKNKTISKVENWMRNEKTKELFAGFAEMLECSVEDLTIKLSNENKFKGTYIHPDLYDHFVAWIDVSYALRISRILKKFHADANRELIQEKDDAIDRLSKKIDEQSQKMNEQSDQIAELLGYAKSTKQTLDEVQEDLTETKEEVELAKTYLVEKSITSTKNPTNSEKHHYFAVTKNTNPDTNVCIATITGGQKSYVRTTIGKKLDQGDELIVNMIYNANPIDLRGNARELFKATRKEIIDKHNSDNAKQDEIFNNNLKIEIAAFNKLNKLNRRLFSSEKRITPKISINVISVKFSRNTFKYNYNPYMSFDDIVQIVLSANKITQTSPMSDDSE